MVQNCLVGFATARTLAVQDPLIDVWGAHRVIHKCASQLLEFSAPRKALPVVKKLSSRALTSNGDYVKNVDSCSRDAELYFRSTPPTSRPDAVPGPGPGHLHIFAESQPRCPSMHIHHDI